MEWVALNHFLWGLLGEEWRALGLKVVWTPRDMVVILECALAILEMGRGGKRTPFQHKLCYPGSQKPGTPQRAQEEPLPPPSLQDETMATDLECHATTSPFKPWLAGCTLHTRPPAAGPHHHSQANWCSSACAPGFRECHYPGWSLCSEQYLSTLWKPGHHLGSWRCSRSPERGLKR